MKTFQIFFLLFYIRTKMNKFWLLLFVIKFYSWINVYRGVIFYDTEKWCKISRKTDLRFGKWHEELGKFSPEDLKVSKLGLWWDSFIQSRKCMSYRVTELYILKRNWLVVLKLTPQFGECWLKHSKVSKMCTLIGSFWPKYIMLELKKNRRVMFDGPEDWCRIWRKTDLSFQKWHEQFGKFSHAEK